MGLFGNHARLGASNPSGYEIDRSLRFNNDGTHYLDRTPSGAGNQRTWTVSFWAKFSELAMQHFPFSTGADSSNRVQFGLESSNKINLECKTSGSTEIQLITNQEFRDTGSWYHFVIKIDTTQGTSSNRAKIYVNGQQITSFSTETYCNQNTDLQWNKAQAHYIGKRSYSSHYMSGYIAEFHSIDGTALDPSSFGETDSDTGAWVPKKASGLTYGTNGFYLNFKDNSGTSATTLGKDQAGSNNWTPNNFSVSGTSTDSFEDTPTNNFPILNYNQTRSASDDRIFDGGLSINWTDGHDNASTVATFGMPSGKWYYEVTNRSDSNAQGAAIIGVCPDSYMAVKICSNTNSWPGFASGSGIGFNGVDQHYTTGSNLGTYGGTWAENDIIGVAVDVDNAKIAMSKNGQWADGSGNYDESSITAGAQKTIPGDAPYFPVFSDTSASHDPKYTVNFGQRAFSYSIPTGYKKLCSKNLPEPSISASTDYFNTVLYTGNAGSQSITSLDFQPDLVWNKIRSTTGNNNLTDSVRGVSKKLMSNNTDQEADQSGDDKGTTAFLSNGFTVKDDAAGNYQQNGPNGATFVAWCWKESATAGFDIVSYTGNSTNSRNISHSLGVSPDLILLKDRSSNSVSNRWTVFHSYDSSKNLELNTDSGAFSHQSRGSITAVSSSNFTLYGSSDNLTVNENGDNYIAYLFAGVDGYSKAGKYHGNGVADGPFVYTGFKPAWIILKATNGNNWAIFDNVRDPENGMDQRLHPNLNNATNDGAGETIDFYSNGFKIRTSDSLENPSGSDVIYYAIAERSFKYATAR